MEDKIQALKLIRKYTRTKRTKTYNDLLKYSRGEVLYNYFKGQMDMAEQIEAYVGQLIKELEEALNENPVGDQEDVA